MKQYSFLLICMLFVFSVSAQQTNSEYFYYYKGEKIQLNVDSSHITIVTEGKMPAAIQKSTVAFSVENSTKSYAENHVTFTDKKQSRVASEDIFFSEIELSEKIDQTEYNNLMEKFKQIPNVLHVLPSFVSGEGRTRVSNNFYVKLHKAEDVNQLYNLAGKYGIEVIGSHKFMPLSYTLACGKESILNSIEAAVLFYETLLFEYAEPELLYKIQLFSNDEYYARQWALKNTGQFGGIPEEDINVERAWEITKGAGIKVAIYDDGIQLDHPDLEANIYGTGYDVMTGGTSPQGGGAHGTECAGIVGAVQNNSICISGVAPECKLMSIRKNNDTYDITSQQIASGFNWAWQNGADIISCSWGLDYYEYPSSVIDRAISDALTYGRNGKGTIVVFASGNYDAIPIPYPQNTNPLILVVGSINPSALRAYKSDGYGTINGSRYGETLDVMAPGVMISTTFWESSYWLGFSGTSAACPHAAGVAALVLSRDPDLTVLEVNNIIESTCRKVGDYTYQTIQCRSNGNWNIEMGYGLVDAYAAVLAVPCPLIRYKNRVVVGNAVVTGCKVLIQDITVQGLLINGAKLTVRAEREVSIEAGFEVKTGSTFEIFTGI